jgi:hypothetical protein
MWLLKRVEVTGEWGKMHYEELHDLYSSQNIIRARWAGYVARVRLMRNE